MSAEIERPELKAQAMRYLAKAFGRAGETGHASELRGAAARLDRAAWTAKEGR